MTAVFKSPSSRVNEIDDNVIANLEWFVIILCDIGSTEDSLTDDRMGMFVSHMFGHIPSWHNQKSNLLVTRVGIMILTRNG